MFRKWLFSTPRGGVTTRGGVHAGERAGRARPRAAARGRRRSRHPNNIILIFLRVLRRATGPNGQRRLPVGISYVGYGPGSYV